MVVKVQARRTLRTPAAEVNCELCLQSLCNKWFEQASSSLGECGLNMTIRSFLQILFACAEALYAHGYSNEACRLTVELARDLLANPPDLKVEQPPTKVERELV